MTDKRAVADTTWPEVPRVRVTVTASEAAWRALVATFSRCSDPGCDSAAEVTIDDTWLCLSCAGKRRRGVLRELPHGDALAAIEAALSPLDPCGKWERDAG